MESIMFESKKSNFTDVLAAAQAHEREMQTRHSAAIAARDAAVEARRKLLADGWSTDAALSTAGRKVADASHTVDALAEMCASAADKVRDAQAVIDAERDQAARAASAAKISAARGTMLAAHEVYRDASAKLSAAFSACQNIEADMMVVALRNTHDALTSSVENIERYMRSQVIGIKEGTLTVKGELPKSPSAVKTPKAATTLEP
jgi:hypothetical protein